MRGFAGIILGFCIGPFFVIGFYGIIQTFIRTSDLSITEGTVVSNVEQLFTGGEMAYVPIIKFSNQENQIFTIYGKTGAIPPKYSPGDKVSVLYDETQPENGMINSFWELWFADTLFVGISLLVFLIFYFAIPKI